MMWEAGRQAAATLGQFLGPRVLSGKRGGKGGFVSQGRGSVGRKHIHGGGES